MPESEPLINPVFVQFHSTVEGGEAGLAFPFLIVHQNEKDEYDGWVFCHDERNSAGLSDGLNWRSNIGKGGPGQNASWSQIPRG
jgi:hypothetical protein